MSLEYPIPRLPNPLTEDGLRNLMRERPYWDLKHPSSSLYQRLVAQGFAMLFPGKMKYDETGKAIEVSPLPPEAVAHQVTQVNREMDRLERSLDGSSFVARDPRDDESRQPFDQRPTGSREGAVHVQAHTRDGGKTEVTDYWRAAPREGRDMDTRAGIRPRDPGEGVQAGTDNQEFLDQISRAEQSYNKPDGGWSDRNPISNELGRYQIKPETLDDIKWHNPDGTWTDEARKHGVASDEDFLKNRDAQKAAAREMLGRYEEQAREKGLYDRIGQSIDGIRAEIEVTEAGLIAAIHRGGATGTAKYFEKIDQAGGDSNSAGLNRGDLAIETRLREFQNVPYERVGKR